MMKRLIHFSLVFIAASLGHPAVSFAKIDETKFRAGVQFVVDSWSSNDPLALKAKDSLLKQSVEACVRRRAPQQDTIELYVTDEIRVQCTPNGDGTYTLAYLRKDFSGKDFHLENAQFYLSTDGKIRGLTENNVSATSEQCEKLAAFVPKNLNDFSPCEVCEEARMVKGKASNPFYGLDVLRMCMKNYSDSKGRFAALKKFHDDKLKASRETKPAASGAR